jgi:hypothetical protein
METTLAQSAKLAVIAATGLSKDALHTHVGLLVYVAALVLTRKPMRSTIPWAITLLVALLGEAVDMRDKIASLGRWHWGASVHDIVNTLLWPSVLVLLARFTNLLKRS